MKILTNKFFILGNLVLILLAIPLTMFFVSRTQQTRSKAAPSSRLYFAPTSATTSTQCPSFTMDVMVDPGSNSVSFVDFTVTYDPSLVSVTGIAPSSTFSTVQVPAKIDGTAGTASISLDAVGGDVTKVVTTTAKVATITFTPKAAGTATLKFDQSKSQVLSLSTSDQPYTNVLSTADQATATIGSDVCPGTPAPSGTSTITPAVTSVITPLVTVPPSASVSATPTIILLPTATPTLIPTSTPIPAVPTSVPTAAPTVPATGSFGQTIGIIGGVILTLGVGFLLLAL
jgi:hypothetical protein